MYRLTREQLDYIREIAPNRRNKEITQLFNKKFDTALTEKQIRSAKKNHKITSTLFYTPEQEQWIKDSCDGVLYKELAKRFNEKFEKNVSSSAIGAKVNSMGLSNNIESRFPKNHLFGADTRFKKGNEPHSKGVPRKLWCKHPEVCEKTQFKKGQMPHNHKPVGTEVYRPESGYWWVKIKEPKKWREKHRLIWEAAHGEIPKGYKLMFADGDHNNCTLDNLRLVTSGEIVTLNRLGLASKNKELTDAGLGIVRLKHKINERRGDTNEQTI